MKRRLTREQYRVYRDYCDDIRGIMVAGLQDREGTKHLIECARRYCVRYGLEFPQYLLEQ